MIESGRCRQKTAVDDLKNGRLCTEALNIAARSRVSGREFEQRQDRSERNLSESIVPYLFIGPASACRLRRQSAQRPHGYVAVLHTPWKYKQGCGRRHRIKEQARCRFSQKRCEARALQNTDLASAYNPHMSEEGRPSARRGELAAKIASISCSVFHTNSERGSVTPLARKWVCM